LIAKRLAVLLVGAGLLAAGCRPSTPEANASPSTDRVATQILKDFEMNDVKNTVTTMTLHSVEARIYDSQQYADVDKPVLLFYKRGRVSSRLDAPQGRVQMQTHEVEAWGGVTVVSSDSSTLTTEKLRYDPKVGKIFSKDAVKIEKPDSITQGIGLETDPELQTVKIGHQKVRFKKGMAH